MKKNMIALVTSACLAMAALVMTADAEAIKDDKKLDPLSEVKQDAFLGHWIAIDGPIEGDTFDILPNGEYFAHRAINGEYDLITLPNGDYIIDLKHTEEETGIYNRVNDSQFTLNNEEPIYTVEQMTQEDVDMYMESKNYISNMNILLYAGAPKLCVDFIYEDNSDPLSSAQTPEKVVFARSGVLGSAYYELALFNKVWTIGNKSLKINEDGKMDLENGSSTGQIAVNVEYLNGKDFSDGISYYIELSWDNGTTIDYTAVEITRDSFVMAKVDNPEETIVFRDGTPLN